MIMGDLNAKNKFWKCITNNKNGNTLCELVALHPITIEHSDAPTYYPPGDRTPSWLDLLVVKHFSNYTQPVAMDLFNSDHEPILTIINSKDNDKPYSKLYNYAKADWPKIKNSINNNKSLNIDINSPEQIDTEIDELTDTLVKSLNLVPTMPKLRLKKFNKETKDLINRRNRARKIYQNTGDDRFRKIKNNLNNKVKEAINNEINGSWGKNLKNLSANDNSLWRFIKRYRRPKIDIPSLENK